jgi:hypothetical protein
MKMPWVTPGARMEVDADRFVLHTLPVVRNGDSHVKDMQLQPSTVRVLHTP